MKVSVSISLSVMLIILTCCAHSRTVVVCILRSNHAVGSLRLWKKRYYYRLGWKCRYLPRRRWRKLELLSMEFSSVTSESGSRVPLRAFYTLLQIGVWDFAARAFAAEMHFPTVQWFWCSLRNRCRFGWLHFVLIHLMTSKQYYYFFFRMRQYYNYYIECH